jgi:hypothetical protein
MAKYININNSGTVTHTLVAKNIQLGISTIKSISITNNLSTIGCNVTLYLYDGTTSYILFEGRFSTPIPNLRPPTYVYKEKAHLAYDQRKFDLKIDLNPDSGTRNFKIIIN